jgi:hypothetical protein
MRSTTLLRLTALLALAVFAALPALAQQDQSADPVADAARKAREQKKNAPPPKKIYTNDDIAPAAQTGPAPAAKSSGDASQAAETAAGPDDEKVKDPQAYWHKRFQKARDDLAKAEKELDVLQRELDKNQVQYYPDPQKALMQQHDRSDINGNQAKIDAKKKEIASLNQQLADLEDELHKAGGNPGWAR